MRCADLKPCLLVACFAVVAAAGPAVGDDGAVTYSEHIAPIIHKNCVECHRPGLGAPFDFRGYEEVARKGRLIAHVTKTGFMPPWKPERGYARLKNERGLDAEELALIEAWVAQGTPEGDPALAPELPPLPESEWRLGEPDIVVEMVEAFDVPADGPDIYRNFVVPLPDFPEGTWVRGIEFLAGAPSVVHHSLLDLDYNGRGRWLDSEDPGPGFVGMDQAFEDSRIGTYAVGSLPYFLPEGVAIKIEPGADLILEMHYHPSGKAEVDRSKVGFYLTKEPPTRRMTPLQIPPSFGITTGLDIPPGESEYTLKHRYKLSHDVEVVNIFPHAHYICKEIKGVAKLPDSTKTTLIWIKNWDFAWQEQYAYEDPPILPAGTVIDITWIYDNSADNPVNPNDPPRRVTWGESSTDEMASLSIGVIPVHQDEFDALLDAHYAYQKKQLREVPLEVLQPVIIAEVLRRFDQNGDGDISILEMPKAAKYWAQQSRLNHGHRSWELQQIIVRRAVGPHFDRIERTAVRTASVAGVTLVIGLLLIVGVIWRRRARRAAREGES
jgi:mono/diheme cytochrome c family protein